MANISNYEVGVQNYWTLEEKRFNNFADMVRWLFVTERLNFRKNNRIGNYLPYVGSFNLDFPTKEEIENNAVKAYKKRMLKIFHNRCD